MAEGKSGYGFDEKTSFRKIDDIFHEERIGRDRSKITFEEHADHLPDGTFVSINDKSYLISGGLMYLWSAYGYENGMPLIDEDKLTVLTPRSVVNAFRAGYVPQMALPAINT